MRKDWEIKRLDQVCTLINGKAFSKVELLNEGKYPVLRVGNFFTNNNWYYSDLTLPEDKYCDNGDLLYAWSASFGPRIWQGGKVIYHYHIWKVIPNEKFITKEFLYLLLDWDTEKIKKDQGTGTTMMHVGKGSMDERILPIPPIPEQKEIVSILNDAFKSIECAKSNAELNLKNSKELFNSYLQDIFENKGEDWEEKTFEELIQESQIGLIKSSREQGKNLKYRYLKMDSISSDNNLLSNKFVQVNATEEEIRKYRLDDGDFLFNTRNSYELVGKTCVFYPIDNEITLFNNNIMRVKFHKDVSPKYINYAFCSPKVKERLEKLKSGTTSVVGIYYKGLRNLKIPITNTKEQNEIVEKIDLLSLEIKKLESTYQHKLNDLEELKKSILQKAFNGELKTSKISA